MRAGIHSIEHGIYLDDEAIDLMLAHGTFLVPTLLAPLSVLEQAETTVDGTGGAAKDSRLTCLGCHRAHASSGPASTRWDPNVEFLDHDGRVSGSYALPNPYAHPDQKALCVKCHYRESTVHGQGAACMSCHRNLG